MLKTILNFVTNNTPLLYLTQSLWRDEAYSVWIAQDSIPEVIRRTSGDFNPPFYYLLLHYWMQIFGRTEIALRSFSFITFLFFLIVVYAFAHTILKTKWAAWLTTLLMAMNPMLLYFAFELRMYALLTFLTTLSMYFFYTENWLWYVVITVLGLYTQPFMIFVIITQSIYLIFTKRFKLFIKNSFFISLLYLPWIPTLLDQFRHSGPMWMYPVNATLALAVLGNLYAGYEGTPGNFWPLMQLLSLLIVIASIIVWRKKTLRKATYLMYAWVGIPTIFVLFISIFKPIYVLRYLIYVTVGEIFLVSLTLHSLKNIQLKNWLWLGVLVTTGIGSFLIAPLFHHKVDLQHTFREIRTFIKPADVIYAETPLVFYESLYYAPQTVRVLLYNPGKIMLPRYVGSVGMPEMVWATEFPLYPNRAFIIQEDGNYRVATVVKKQ